MTKNCETHGRKVRVGRSATLSFHCFEKDEKLFEMSVAHVWWQNGPHLLDNMPRYFRFVVVQSAGEYSHDESTRNGDDGHDGSYSDSDEEEETQGIVTGTKKHISIKCGFPLPHAFLSSNNQ